MDYFAWFNLGTKLPTAAEKKNGKKEEVKLKKKPRLRLVEGDRGPGGQGPDLPDAM